MKCGFMVGVEVLELKHCYSIFTTFEKLLATTHKLYGWNVHGRFMDIHLIITIILTTGQLGRIMSNTDPFSLTL